MSEEPSATQNNRLLPRAEKGFNDLCKELRRRTFDDEVRERLQSIYCDDGHLILQMRQTGARGPEVSRGNGREHAARYSGIERLGHFQPDRAETRDCDPHRRYFP